MIRQLRNTADSHSPLAAVTGERAHDDVRVLRELVTALCDRVELLEAQAFLVRPLQLARVPS